MITAIILAAGFSRRFGGKKLLMEIEDKPIIQWVIDEVVNFPFHEIILIYQDEEIKTLAEKKGIKCVYNHKAIEGMSTSVKLGIENASKTCGYLFFTGDQPFIDRDTIQLLIDGFHEKKGSIIVPRYDGKRGNPVLFSSKWKRKFMNISGDQGGRDIIKSNLSQVSFIDIPNKKVGIDIDTKEEYIKICED